MDEQEEILDQSIKPGTLLGRIPGETGWYDVEQANKQYKNDLLKLKSLYKEKKNLHPDEFKKTYCIEIKQIHSRLRLKDNYKNKNSRRKDLKFKIIDTLRKSMRIAILYGTDNPKLIRLLGCAPENGKIHLEQQFKPGMTWKNTDIDHIIPLNSYNPFDPIQMEKAFNFRNLQPLFKRDNSVKGIKHKLEDKQKYDNSFIYDDGKLIFKGGKSISL